MNKNCLISIVKPGDRCGRQKADGRQLKSRMQNYVRSLFMNSMHFETISRISFIEFENFVLRKTVAERNHLSNELHQIRVQNSYLSSLVEEFQHKTPMVVVRNKEPEVQF